ncbi:Protein of unknown function [Bacillus cereus]|nr:Protein of unknown function [Bacillus cereus]SCN35694.1 Protein of unknown function [Bacillus wiedmannii]
MYTVELIIKSGFECSCTTLFIGG